MRRLVLLSGLGLGVVVAYLLVTGKWHFALAIILLLPGAIVLHKYPFLTLLGWLLLSPFLLHTTTNVERQIYWIVHRGLPPLTVAIIWLSAVLHIRPRRLPPLGAPELAMGAYLVFGCLSIALQSGMPQPTLYHFYDRVFSPMCLYLIIRLTVPGTQAWRWLLPVFFFIAVFQATVGITSWVAPSLLPAKWLDKVGQRTTGTLVNPSIYTTALIFAGCLLLHGAFRVQQKRLRLAFLTAFLLSLFGVIISLSRASWLAGTFLILGLLFLYPKWMLKLSFVVLILSLLIGSLLLPPYVDKARQRLYSEEAQGSALDRLPGYLAAWRMFQEKPLFGWGYGNFDLYDRQFMGRVLDFSSDNKDHASHNWYLSILAEQGLVGVLLFFGPLGWWLAMSFKKWGQLPRRGVWNRNLLLLLWLIVLVQVVINNFMNMIIFLGHGFWWIVLGLIANLVAGRRLPEQADVLTRKATAVWQTAPYQPHR